MATKSELTKQLDEADLPKDLKAYIAARLVNSIDMYFPHALAEKELLSGQYLRNLITQCLASETRSDFYFLCQSFMASFHNGHTEFHDRCLFEALGAPIGFHAAPVDGQWVVTESRIDGLSRGDVILRIDDQPVALFFDARKDLISASTKHYAEHTLFFSPLLFPQDFTVTLEGGEVINVQRNMNRPVNRCKVLGETEDGVMAKAERFPDGSQFEGIGIVPHHHVHPTITSLKAGIDPVFQKGIEILKQQLCV